MQVAHVRETGISFFDNELIVIENRVAEIQPRWIDRFHNSNAIESRIERLVVSSEVDVLDFHV